MAFNNYDKLTKAQRDYPKPKFALSFIDKQLKKNAVNAYLLTWKADVQLRLAYAPDLVQQGLDAIVDLSTFTDPELMTYWYSVAIETLRKQKRNLDISQVGPKATKAWTSVAKSFQRPNERREFWETLFAVAVQHDCWEDARNAVLNYNKESNADKKQLHYTLIMTTQLAGEQKGSVAGSDDPVAKIQYLTALKYMKQSWDAPADDALAIKDIRDLRFMADIFARQNRASELLNLWASPPAHLKMLFQRHRDDLLAVETRVARSCLDWELLGRHCEDTIQEKLSNLDLAKESHEKIRDLCAWNWEVWESLIEAAKRVPGGNSAKTFVQRQMAEAFGFKLKAMDRPIQLTFMRLRQFTEELTIDDCKIYFETHGHLNSCFQDLRPFLRDVSRADTIDFLRSITKHTQMCAEACDTTQGFDRWRQLELNVIKFLYLTKVTRNPDVQRETIEPLLARTASLYQIWPDASVGYLLIYILLTLHSLLISHGKEDPVVMLLNSRILLQATMFARILVANDKEKQNRSMSLLAARLHLNLGLGTIGFQLYRHVKCKEMLQDTLSPFVLQSISRAHPMDVGGKRGFSADDELSTVYTTIERMERKIEGFLSTDLPSFRWDRALELRTLKKKLRSSQTRTMCLSERHYVAWIKGESWDSLPNFDSSMTLNQSDNIDWNIFEHFDIYERSSQARYLIVPNSMLDAATYSFMWFSRRMLQLVFQGEPVPASAINYVVDRLFEAKHVGKGSPSAMEVDLQRVWGIICICMAEVELEQPAQMTKNPERNIWHTLPELLQEERKTFESLRLPSSTTLKPEDEPTMSHENMLISCIGWLEVVRTVNKFCDYLRDKVWKTKNKTLLKIKACLPQTYVDDLHEEAQIFYNAIRDVAQSYIVLLNARGVKAIKAQVRWGLSGELLRELMTDDDVEFYAKEYVDSALEGWKGVLKIKLK